MATNKQQPMPVDPIWSPQQMCDDAGISMDTWRRNYRHELPIIQLSKRRIGARRSAWRAALGEPTDAPQPA